MNDDVTAQQFVFAFQKEWESVTKDGQENVSKDFSDNRRWTEFMCAKNLFLHKTVLRCKSDIRYWRENYTIDCVAADGEDLLQRDGGYPSHLRILIEHENGDHIEEEMWKLIHWRAPLKVLIFYDYNDKSRERKEKHRKWCPDKLIYLRSMLAAVNSFHAEDPRTEYLAVIGARRSPGGQIYWRFESISGLSEIVSG